MPKAVVVRSAGGPEVLEYSDVPAPVPGDGELLVRVGAAGVNYIDTYQRSGQYSVPLPTALGLEGAGEVVASNSADFAVGDRVAWMSVLGSYASEVVVPASAAVRVPDGLDVELAAAALLQGITAHYLTHSTHVVKDGDRVLVHAAAGGVGLLLTQWAKARGAFVVATVSTDEKEALAREAGADQVLRYGDFASQIEKVDVVYDGVGRDTFDQSLASLKPRGLLALFGASSGPVPPVDPQRLNAAGSVYLTRPSTGAYLLDRAEFEWRAADLFGAIVDGTLNIRIGGRYELEEAAQAHTDLQSRRTTGKLLLLP
ncbi:NADPH:quinone reductase-like Zn-dependent oxidoreductase [Lentzea atacamensis]|uniref:NADPH:quinone reductase-like Zn-dependent oxidoreductase n=1 Tax=Lentzea atacamensis TaxID=531938 RepID=A0ABX9DZE2_9PSEU|nr:quinone oxidoreductase [Lentzea atacamensis]RAS59934.1 NADPH:quinone reductase-like Zn-dependent oxidoreductase [Lentzea atacamensis]